MIYLQDKHTVRGHVNPILFAALILSANTAAARSHTLVSPPVVITPALEIAKGRSLDQALVAPFPETFTVTNAPAVSPAARKVHSCRDYLALGRRELETGSTLDDLTLLYTGTRCVALDWIAGVSPTSHGPIPRFSFHSVRVRQLPPQLALVISPDDRSAAQEASRRGESILAMESDVTLKVQGPDKARLISSAWTEDLTLYAYGDFLGDDSEQIIVQANAGVVGGTYKTTYLYLLTRKAKGWVVVRRYPDNPQGG